jgi:hypothetical protein
MQSRTDRAANWLGQVRWVATGYAEARPAASRAVGNPPKRRELRSSASPALSAPANRFDNPRGVRYRQRSIGAYPALNSYRTHMLARHVHSTSLKTLTLVAAVVVALCLGATTAWAQVQNPPVRTGGAVQSDMPGPCYVPAGIIGGRSAVGGRAGAGGRGRGGGAGVAGARGRGGDAGVAGGRGRGGDAGVAGGRGRGDGSGDGAAGRGRGGATGGAASAGRGRDGGGRSAGAGRGPGTVGTRGGPLPRCGPDGRSGRGRGGE